MTSYGRFKDRLEAGQALATVLVSQAFPDPVVLALPRGGVPVAAEVARALKAPLDLILVRKIGVEYQPELAAAAVVNGELPQIVVNDEVLALAHVSQGYIRDEAKQKLAEIERRRKTYLQGRRQATIKDRSAIIVDDGVATGTTVRAAIKALRLREPKAIILAVPVAPAETIEALRPELDDIVCLETPEPFYAIGMHYRDFHQVSDEEVVQVLAGNHAQLLPRNSPNSAPEGSSPSSHR